MLDMRRMASARDADDPQRFLGGGDGVSGEAPDMAVHPVAVRAELAEIDPGIRKQVGQRIQLRLKLNNLLM
jgi:hypothetical protein